MRLKMNPEDGSNKNYTLPNPVRPWKLKKWRLLTLVSWQIVHLEIYSLRLLRLQPYILRPYNLHAKFERSKSTTFGKPALDLFIT